jgi:hypothetical protein
MMRSDTSGGISVIGIIVVLPQNSIGAWSAQVPGDSFDKQFSQ